MNVLIIIEHIATLLDPLRKRNVLLMTENDIGNFIHFDIARY